MLEAIVIIVALGGLELLLWLLGRREARKELELLDAIWTELALRNATEEQGRKTNSHEEAAPLRRS